MDKGNKANLIQSVVDIELDMFLKVPTAEPTGCQQSPDGFRLVRSSILESWSEETLSLYLSDLQNARSGGRNLLTEKYARMSDLIPPINTNPIIDEIVEIESRWQLELGNKYPHLFGKGSTQYCGDAEGKLLFAKYLKSELETYSNETLESYRQDLQEALDRGANLSEEKNLRLFQKLGFSSLDEAEKKRAGKEP